MMFDGSIVDGVIDVVDLFGRAAFLMVMVMYCL